jgi:hypothetical protein
MRHRWRSTNKFTAPPSPAGTQHTGSPFPPCTRPSAASRPVSRSLLRLAGPPAIANFRCSVRDRSPSVGPVDSRSFHETRGVGLAYGFVGWPAAWSSVRLTFEKPLAPVCIVSEMPLMVSGAGFAGGVANMLRSRAGAWTIASQMLVGRCQGR